MRRLCSALIAAAAIALAGCGASAPKDCIVLAVGGNKLCGADAAAWCRSTDSLRNAAHIYDPGADPNERDAVLTCNDLEDTYPQ